MLTTQQKRERNKPMASEAARKLKFYLQGGTEGFKAQGLDRVAALDDPELPVPFSNEYPKLGRDYIEALFLKLILKYDLV